MHDSLFADQGQLDPPHLWQRCRDLGIDLERFEADRRSDAVAERVQARLPLRHPRRGDDDADAVRRRPRVPRGARRGSPGASGVVRMARQSPRCWRRGLASSGARSARRSPYSCCFRPPPRPGRRARTARRSTRAPTSPRARKRPSDPAAIRARPTGCRHGSARQGVLDIDARTGTPRMVRRLDGFLTGPSGADPERVVLDYVRAQRAVFGLSDDDLAALRARAALHRPAGTTHLLWAQTWRGIRPSTTACRPRSPATAG